MPVTNIGSRWNYGFLEFYDKTRNHTVDVEAPTKLFFDFNGPAIDSTNDLNVTTVGGTMTSVNGWMTMTTSAVDDDNNEVATELLFQAENICVMEARLRNNDATNSAVFVGFTSAITAGADSLPIFGQGDALNTVAVDAAGFYHDADRTTAGNLWRAATVDTNVDGVEVDSTAPVNSQIENFRIALDENGYAYFWHSSGTNELEYIGSDILVGVTPTVSLCAYVGNINRAAGNAETCDVDFIRVWGGKID